MFSAVIVLTFLGSASSLSLSSTTEKIYKFYAVSGHVSHASGAQGMRRNLTLDELAKFLNDFSIVPKLIKMSGVLEIYRSV